MIMYKLHFSDYKPKLLKIDSTASSKEFIYHVDKDDKLISELKEGWAETKEKAIEIALYRS